MYKNRFGRSLFAFYILALHPMPTYSDHFSKHDAYDNYLLGDESCPSSLIISGTVKDMSDITGEKPLSSRRIIMPFTTMDWECAETLFLHNRSMADGAANSKIPDLLFNQGTEIVTRTYPRRLSPDTIIRGYAVDGQLGEDPSISIFSIATPQDKTVPEFLIIHKDISLSGVLPTMAVDVNGLPIKAKYGYKPNRVFYTDLIHRFDLLTYLRAMKNENADTISTIKLVHFSDNITPLTCDNCRENPLGSSWINGLLNRKLTSLDTADLSLQYIPYNGVMDN